MKILYLPLKKEWYEMIERGDKREEYRENTRYWKTRLIDTVILRRGGRGDRKPGIYILQRLRRSLFFLRLHPPPDAMGVQRR
jgi:hypothetical protein